MDVPLRGYVVNRESKGLGAKEVVVHTSPGVWQLDARQLAKDKLGLKRDGLNAVARIIFKDAAEAEARGLVDDPENPASVETKAEEIMVAKYQKLDVNVRLIRPEYVEGDPEKRRKWVEYCVQDSELVMGMCEQRGWFQGLCAEAKSFGMLPRHITTLGKQALLTRLAHSFAHPLGMLIPKHRSLKSVPANLASQLKSTAVYLDDFENKYDDECEYSDCGGEDEDGSNSEEENEEEHVKSKHAANLRPRFAAPPLPPRAQTMVELPSEEGEPLVPFFIKIPFRLLPED